MPVMPARICSGERCAPGLPEPTLAAFGDAVYNLGPTIVCNPAQSTAARLLKQGDIKAACNQLPRWDKARVSNVSERVITIDDLLLASVFIALIDEAKNHYDFRSIYSKEVGRALA
jgi:hypothetical protein